MRFICPLGVLGLSFMLILAGCGGGGPVTNRPPVINSSSPDSPYALFKGVGVTGYGGAVNFTVGATDPDGDAMTYSWSATDGSSGADDQPTFVWTPPASPALPTAIQVSVMVSDGTNNVNRTWNVNILNSQIHYDVNRNAWWNGTGMSLSAAIHLPPSKLAPYAGRQIGCIYVYSEYDSTQVTFAAVCTSAGEEPGTTAVATVTPRAVGIGWNQLNLSAPVAVTESSDLWVVCTLQSTGTCGFGIDTTSENVDGNWIRISTTAWTHFYEHFETHANICLRAGVVLP